VNVPLQTGRKDAITFSAILLRFLQSTTSTNALSMDESNFQEIDESKLQAISRGDSIYISLKERRNAETREGSQSPRRAVSRECPTHIHFPIHDDGHWAAVQLSILPFELQDIPKQKFFQSRFRYTWCCETAPRADITRDVQGVYDDYFHPSPWDFSHGYWYVLGKLSPPNVMLTRSAAPSTIPNPHPLRTKLHV
jgi:hypothetical protein